MKLKKSRGATQPLFFDKRDKTWFIGFYLIDIKKGIEPDLNRGLIHNINRKEQGCSGDLNQVQFYSYNRKGLNPT